ncbi:SGNH/GDSL hydrolase family protein [Bradyrhizobium sp. LA2.1]|uniref:SGNH/GDSL hydrolase family protein n=1 Tax=Bradyrhizobium sp. LA2.1 TaxID=3156376 RepID=UPI003399F2DE
MIRAVLLIFAIVTAPAAAQDHAEVRSFVIKSQLAQAGDDPVVLIGDSITESALLPAEVCGHALINAGVGGATVNSYLRAIIRGIPPFKASVIVVALGTNDALASNANLSEDYERFIDILGSYSGTILLAGLPSVGERFDQGIRLIAKRKGLSFIDLRPGGEASTIDGIHLSPEGYKPWMSAMIGSIRHAMHC